jgi:NlpC/P60 family putative phage cell wall peptidase
MISGEDVVAEARRWLGTPYCHQASCRGGGTDCLGLLRGTWRTLLGTEPELVPPYTQDWSEPGGQEDLLAAARRWLLPKEGSGCDPGDVLVFRMRAGLVAKHVGIAATVAAHPTFIHAYSGHGVVETALSEPWARRVVARFTFPKGA